MGPVANARQLAVMERMVKDALGRGGRIMYGGQRGNGRGYFWHPTVMTDVPDDALLLPESTSVPLRQFPASRLWLRLLRERPACPPAWRAMVSPLHSTISEERREGRAGERHGNARGAHL